MRVKPAGNYSKDLEIEAYAYISEDIKDMDPAKLFDNFKSFVILKTRELLKLKNYEAKIENNRILDLAINVTEGTEELIYKRSAVLSIYGRGNCPISYPISGMFDDDENMVIMFGNESISYHAIMALIENEDLTYAELNQKRFDPEE